MRVFFLGIALLFILLLQSCQHDNTEAAQRIVYRGIAFDTYSVNLQRDKLRLYWLNEQGKRYGNIQALQQHLASQNKRLLFATNAGIYTPEYAPVGLHVENGKQLRPLDTNNGQGNFYLKPNGVFFVSQNGKAGIVETSSFAAKTDTLLLALQSGPLLVGKNSIHPAFRKYSTSTYVRSGVGVRSDSIVVFAISNEPVPLHRFASFFRDVLHCPNALYLDGFVSRMYIPPLEREEIDGNFAGILGVVAP